MRIVKGPGIVGYTVQPKTVTAFMDAGCIGVGNSRRLELLFGYSFKRIQGFISRLVEIENRAFAWSIQEEVLKRVKTN